MRLYLEPSHARNHHKVPFSRLLLPGAFLHEILPDAGWLYSIDNPILLADPPSLVFEPSRARNHRKVPFSRLLIFVARSVELEKRFDELCTSVR